MLGRWGDGNGGEEVTTQGISRNGNKELETEFKIKKKFSNSGYGYWMQKESETKQTHVDKSVIQQKYTTHKCDLKPSRSHSKKTQVILILIIYLFYPQILSFQYVINILNYQWVILFTFKLYVQCIFHTYSTY